MNSFSKLDFKPQIPGVHCGNCCGACAVNADAGHWWHCSVQLGGQNGQYDDLEGPAHRILYDDDKDRIPEDAITGLEKTRRSAGAPKDKPQIDTYANANTDTSKADKSASKSGDGGT